MKNKILILMLICVCFVSCNKKGTPENGIVEDSVVEESSVNEVIEETAVSKENVVDEIVEDAIAEETSVVKENAVDEIVENAIAEENFERVFYFVGRSGNIYLSQNFIKIVDNRNELHVPINEIKIDENGFEYYDSPNGRLYFIRNEFDCWTYSEDENNRFGFIEFYRQNEFASAKNYNEFIKDFLAHPHDEEWSFSQWRSNYGIKSIGSSSHHVEQTSNGLVEYICDYINYLTYENYEKFRYYEKDPWVPGKEKNEDGIGEYLDIEFVHPSDYVTLLNGYCHLEKRYLYKANNRVKTAVITSLDEDNPFEFEYTFDDYVHFSKINFPCNVSKVRITIKDVYYGERWHDTCIYAVMLNWT